MNKALLIIDDDQEMVSLMQGVLQSDGYMCATAHTGEAGNALLRQGRFMGCILDYDLPGKDGLSVLAELRKTDPRLPVLFCTGHNSLGLAVKAIQAGASDFLPKPFNKQQLVTMVGRILQRQASGASPATGGAYPNFENDMELYGRSESLRQVLGMVTRIAHQGSNTPVLIQGEMGTGKGLLAKAIHKLSPRRDKPFIEMNCSAVQSALREESLFGKEGDANGSAKLARGGFFEAAHGGILFLDEVSELSLELQSKLLKVLEEQRFYRVGGTQAVQVDVMVIATSHRPLSTLVEQGIFREDLYYRLQVLSIWVAPLRERREDLLAIAHYFLQYFCKKNAKSISGFDAEFLEWFVKNPFKGNARELRNAIERAVILQWEPGPLRWVPSMEPLRGVATEGGTHAVWPSDVQTHQVPRSLSNKSAQLSFFQKCLGSLTRLTQPNGALGIGGILAKHRSKK